MACGVTEAFQKILRKFPELLEIFSEEGGNIDYRDLVDAPSYYLQRAYEALLGRDSYVEFIKILSEMIEKDAQMFEAAKMSIGEAEFLRLSSLTRTEAERYLYELPLAFQKMIGTESLLTAIEKGGFVKK